MDGHPDIAPIASLIGDRARAAILLSLMDGRSLTATELARAAQVTRQTASSHLSKLVDAGLVTVENAGRHRYIRLSNHEVATVIEHLSGLAQRLGATQLRPGPADPALRKARICYDHLAGDLGVMVFDSLVQQGFVSVDGKRVTLTDAGAGFCRTLGIDAAAMEQQRRPVCLACLDWSVRRSHLAGALGAALLNRSIALGWARLRRGSRVVAFSPAGERSLRARFR